MKKSMLCTIIALGSFAGCFGGSTYTLSIHVRGSGRAYVDDLTDPANCRSQCDWEHHYRSLTIRATTFAASLIPAGAQRQSRVTVTNS